MLLNIDWLQIHCKGILQNTKRLQFKPSGYGTKQFKTVGKLILDKEEVATVSMHPHAELSNGGMSTDTILFKFSNKYLYQPPAKLREFILSVLNEIPELKIVGLSRTDIALDFNRFVNDYKPGDMIKDFCSEKILKNSRGNFKTEGTHNREIKYHYLRFGNHTSERSIYLYNKTKEMNERTMKLHIFRGWQQCAEINPVEDVWRLELSLKGNKHMLLVDEYKGEITEEEIAEQKYIIRKQVVREEVVKGKLKKKIDLCHLEVNQLKLILKAYNENHALPSGFVMFRKVRFIDLLDENFLKQLFFTCLYQNFTFRHNSGIKNKSQMKPVELFREHCEFNRVHSLPETKDATRSNRIFIKHLHKHIQDMKGMNEVISADVENVDSNLFTPEDKKAALEQMDILRKVLEGGETVIQQYSKLYDLAKYLSRVKHLEGG